MKLKMRAIDFSKRPTASTPAIEGPISQVQRQKRILIMEDDLIVRRIFAKFGERLGYSTETVEEGNGLLEAYKKAKSKGRPFDIVIIDLEIKNGMGGREAIARLLETDPDAKAVISSGIGPKACKEIQQELGFADHLPKPFGMAAFKLLIERNIK